MTTHKDHPSYVKHPIGSIYVFFALFGCSLLKEDSLRGGLAEGNRISETGVFDILTIHNDEVSYVKHPFYVVFTLFGVFGGCKGGWGTNADAFPPPW